MLVFFLWLFAVHQSLKNTLERQQGKGTPANDIATQRSKDRKNHSLLTTRSTNRRKNIAWGNTPRNVDLQSFITKSKG